MKIHLFVITLVLLCFGQSSMAQVTAGDFSGASFAPGFFVGPVLHVGPLGNEVVGFAGVQAGLTLGDRWSVGGMYSFSFHEFSPEAESDPDVYWDVKMGGLTIEYRLQTDRLWYISFPVSVGLGEVEADWKDGSPNYGTEGAFGEANFTFVQPGAVLEVKLASFARLFGGATYRWVPGNVDYRGVREGDLGGLTGMLGLKFGLFR
jgi:hypothetical protein